MSSQTIFLIVYLGMMPIWFVPVCRFWRRDGGVIESQSDLMLGCLLVLMTLGAWPLWAIAGLPIYGFAQLVKYTINYEQKVKAS